MPSRYGFQGEFAEDETEETGYVSFELRHYDAVVGRWVNVDPMRQFHSPYIGMGNNPISSIDPDGGQCYDADGDPITYPDTWQHYEGEDNHIRFLDEVEVSAGMSQSAVSAAKLGIYQANYNFMMGSLDLVRYSFSRVGAATTATGLIITPFALPAGATLIGVGETLSTIGGVSSAVLNASEGKVSAAVTDVALLGIGAGGSSGLKNLKINSTLDLTGETILRSIQNASLDIMNFFCCTSNSKTMILAAILCFIIGIYFLYRVIKHPVEDDDEFLNGANIKLYGFSVGMILIGIIILIRELG